MIEIAATTAAWPATVPHPADSTVRRKKPEEAAAWMQAKRRRVPRWFYGEVKDVLDKLDSGQAVEDLKRQVAASRAELEKAKNSLR
jgi:hypothetical protein